jgi:putative ABC transport system permease protein
VEARVIYHLSLAALRLIARLVPWVDRATWLREWEAELHSRRTRLAARNALTRQQEFDMFRRVLGSFHDAAWLRRQLTRDADLVRDMGYGARLLRRNPGFAILTVAVLALGMGATTGIFSVVDALLVRQLPYRDPERIVLLFEAPSTNPAAAEGVSPANFLDWKAQVQTLEFLTAAEPIGYTYTSGDEPQSIPGMRVSSGFFESFGMDALYGRTFTPEEYTAGRNLVAVLSYATWTQRFGADRGIVGRVIRLNRQPHTIVGVMPPAFAPRLLVTFSERGVWTPKIWAEIEQRVRGARYYNAVGKLKHGVTIQQAQAELDGIAERLAQQYPRTNTGQMIQLVSLRDHLAGDLRPSIGLLSGAVVLLLLIAMANSANLLMAHASTRVREIAVRNAIGADRNRLVRQLLAETLTIAAFGCLLGFFVAYSTVRIIISLAPSDIPGLAAVGMNGRVLLFSGLLTCVVALFVGVIPAWRVSGWRSSAPLTSQASDDARVAPRQRGRAVFVVAELALALTLLAAGGLLLRSFSRLLETSPGFSPEGVAALQIFLPSTDGTPAQRVALLQQVIDRMRSVPGVLEAGAASVIPFLNTTGGGSSAIVIERRPPPVSGDEPSAMVIVATPGYFPTMRIPLLDGRMLSDHDDADSAAVVLVSRAFAARHWREASPIGQRLRFTALGRPLVAEIVGVVEDTRHDALDLPGPPVVFVSLAQVPSGAMTFVVRTASDPALALPALQSQIRAVFPERPVYRTAALPDLVAGTLTGRRFMLTLMLAFAVLAVTLAATGVYGVMSLLSTQRTKEFGLRLALGADRTEILGMVLRQGAMMIAIGVAIGLGGSLMMGQVLRRFLFGIGPNDPWTLTAVSVVLGVTGAIACLLPAIRATRVSPLVALRSE